MQFVINLPKNLDMTYKVVQRVCVPNFKLFGPIKTELCAKELQNFLLCYAENGPVDILLPTNMAVAV